MKKVILFLTVFSFFIAGNANAGFISGWGFKWGSIDAEVEIKGTGKTSDGDTVTIDGTIQDIEYVCQNPGINKFVVEGTPGRFEVEGTEPIDETTAIQKNGKTIVSVKIEISEVDLGLACVNPNWTPLPGSAVPKQLNLFITWSDCSGVPDKEVCSIGDSAYVEKDQVEVECKLDPIERDIGTLLPLTGQDYVCD